jgi:hypothetical protein
MLPAVLEAIDGGAGVGGPVVADTSAAGIHVDWDNSAT